MTPAPKICPACGADIKSYTPASPEDDYEGWEFVCDAVILRADNGKLFVEDDCTIVTLKAVKALNDAAAISSKELGGRADV